MIYHKTNNIIGIQVNEIIVKIDIFITKVSSKILNENNFSTSYIHVTIMHTTSIVGDQ